MQRSQSFTDIQELNNCIPIELFERKGPQYYENQYQQQYTIFQQSFALHTRLCQTPLQKYQNYDLGNTVIKQGIVQIKINNGGFNKTNILLTREKLVFIEEKQWGSVYNLRFLGFNLVQCSKNQFKLFKLEFKQYQKVIIFKCNDDIEGKLWFQCIRMIEEKFLKEIEKLHVRDIYFGLDFVREEEFLNWTETGDILLFETDHYMAKLQRGITGSKYDHVGMIVREKYENDILVFDVKNQAGVDLEFWKYFMKKNNLYKKVAVRKLLNVDREIVNSKLLEFIDKVRDQDYEINIMKLLQQQSDGLINRGYFCSELIAKAYKYCDLLPQQKASSQYWPVTFQKTLKLLNKAQLSEPITIFNQNIVNRHGFQCKTGINYYQIGVVILYIGHFIIILFQTLDYNQVWILISIFSFINSIFWFITTKIDPTDQEIYIQYKLREKKVKYETKLNCFCKVCQAYVKGPSKHCKQCNRCTELFDHHCVWLNNCIGLRNYKYFFILIVLLELYLITGLIISIFVNKILSYVHIGVTIILMIPITFLLVMHIYFKCKNMTTYDFVLSRRKNQLKLSQDKLQEKLQEGTSNQTNLNTNIISRNYLQQTNLNLQSALPKPNIIKQAADWDQEEADVEEGESYHAKEPLPLPSQKSSARQMDSQCNSGHRRTCPNTQRGNTSTIQLTEHKPIRSLFNVKDFQQIIENQMMNNVNEGSIIHFDSKHSQKTDQIEINN
ncbi:unnamed protein product [Paramecium sonneborni]|uniref:Palmitoyltransferase n=1 Tax=Paramecium sonneborni TaxID=65129 RepID=A0A8S1R238_9CILI|nr:unnamed protein product [Paramecium sonneborni]